MSVDAAREVVRRAIGARTFSGAVADVGASRGPLWREPFGRVSLAERSRFVTDGTIFDLASLTKVVATSSLVLQLVHDGGIQLEDPVSTFFEEWRGSDRETVTVQDLLEHSSGLAARLVDTPPGGRREFEHDICAMPLEYAPRTASIYSDLGFILLGFLVADRSAASLAEGFEAIRQRLASAEADVTREPLGFDLDRAWRDDTAPTRPMEDDPRRGRGLTGEVHDHYAAALGGVAGHAGLFGSAAAVAAFARAALRGARGDAAVPTPLSPALVARAVKKSSVPGSSRALGWDTMLPTSSCGTRMSAAACGHVGYTGTSLWIDPTRDRYFVLLTNRANGGGTLEQMRAARRAFHDALGDL